MNIAFLAHDKKKELMVQFCTAYKSIAYNEIDLVLLFNDPNVIDPFDDNLMLETIRHCDKHNVPIATNLASAEMLIMGLQRGDLDWREMLHTTPKY